MVVWLITIGEPLPLDGQNERLLRTGLFAELLVESGHEVTWWTSTMDHSNLQQRRNKDEVIQLKNRYRIYLLRSINYKKNISLRRVVNHIGLARKFKRFAQAVSPVPDVILCSVPAVEIALQATRFGKANDIPVVLDMRDLWPDIILDLAPWWAKAPARFLLFPMFVWQKRACSQATAITGITPSFVEWGLRYAGRDRTKFDKDFPLAYPAASPAPASMRKGREFWETQGIGENSPAFLVCFFGSIRPQFEWEVVIGAARELQRSHPSIKFVICGQGELLPFLKKMAEDCDNVLLPGHVGRAEILVLMEKCSVALAPYRSTWDFMASIPTKAIEYLAGRLPILSSLKGELESLLSQNSCGITYANEDPNTLVEQLLWLYNRPRKRAEMSRNAKRLFDREFAAEKVYQNMADHLQSIVSAHRRGII